MLSKIWTSLTSIENDEKKYIKTVLYAILGVALIAIIALTVTTLAVGDYSSLGLLISMFVISAGLLLLTWRDYVAIPRLVLPLMVFLASAYSMRVGWGLRDGITYLLPMDLVLAGLLLGQSAVVVFTALDLAVIGLQTLGEINGSIVNIFSSFTTYQTLVSFAVLLSVTGILLYVTIGNLNRNLRLAQQNERKFAESNRELKEIQSSLEDRVEARTAQIRASAELGRAVTTTLNPEQLLHEVVSLITDRFGYTYAAIFLLDETGKFAVLREATGEAGQTLKERGHQLEVGGRSMVGQAAAQRKLRLASDVGQDALRFDNPLLPDIRAEIALPLIVGDRVMGVLDVQATRENAFDEASATVLQSLADQIAIALNNADQYQREQVRLEQTSTLLKATLHLSQLTDQIELQERTIDLAQQLLKADGAGLWLPVGNDEIELKSTTNTLLIGIAGRRLKIGEGLSGQVFATGTALRVSDYRTWGGHSEAFTDAPVRAALAVPLMLHDQVAGVLLVTHSRLDATFTVEDENIAQLLAAQAAAAISMADLLAQQRHTVEELNEANRRLTSEAWGKYTKALPGGIQRQAYLAQSLESDSSLQTLPEIELAMSARQPSIWIRPDTAPATDAHVTGLAAPIILRGEVLGALQVGEENLRREWTEDEVTFIQAVADQVALALDNARLLEDTERRAQRERLVADISSRMFAANDLETIVQIAGEELGRILQVRNTRVRVGLEALQAGVSSNGQQEVQA